MAAWLQILQIVGSNSTVLHYFTMHFTTMTAPDPSSYGSPNLLQYLEMWKKIESNIQVCPSKEEKKNYLHKLEL